MLQQLLLHFVNFNSISRVFHFFSLSLSLLFLGFFNQHALTASLMMMMMGVCACFWGRNCETMASSTKLIKRQTQIVDISNEWKELRVCFIYRLKKYIFQCKELSAKANVQKIFDLFQGTDPTTSSRFALPHSMYILALSLFYPPF